MPERQDPDHLLDRALRESLDRIDAHLKQICGEAGPLDPDQVVEDLKRETSRMEKLVEEVLGRRADATHNVSCALNQVLQEASQEVLSCLTFPVVIQSELEENLPRVLLHAEPLKALLRRILLLTCGHAGLGGEVRLTTGAEDAQACMQLVALPGTESALPMSPVSLRYRSVERFVSSLGGQLAVTLEPDGSLKVLLHLKARAERV